MESKRRELTAEELAQVNGAGFLALLKELADFILGRREPEKELSEPSCPEENFSNFLLDNPGKI